MLLAPGKKHIWSEGTKTLLGLCALDGSRTLQNLPRRREVSGRTWQGNEKALTFCSNRRGAVAVEGADNSQGELFTPTEDGWSGWLVGTESWSQRQGLVCCAQALTRGCCTDQHSWSIGRPDEKVYLLSEYKLEQELE